LNSTLASVAEGGDAGSGAECCETAGKVQSTEIEACGRKLKVRNIVFMMEIPRMTEDSQYETYDPKLKYENVFVTENETRFCQFWDTQRLQWSGEGCETLARYDDHILCTCSHLSTFSGAFGKTFGKLGKNNAALLLKKPKVDFTHAPFIVVLCWTLVLYSPCVYCNWRDKKDYKSLKERKELFKDKYPRHSQDFICLLFPGFRICSGFVMCLPIFINCSKLKRRLRSAERP